MLTKQVIILSSLLLSTRAMEFQIKNNGRMEIWIGILGNNGKPSLKNGGFKLGVGEQVSVIAPDDWSGSFWARTGCDQRSNHCSTGDCGNKVQCNGADGKPPITLVQINLNGFGGTDVYDISLVDEFNIKAAITPIGVNTGDGTDCGRAVCNNCINAKCPKELQVKNNSSNVIGCNSACAAFNTAQYCCRGNYNSPQTCDSNDWPVNYAEFFKKLCPNAISYSYDEETGTTFSCRNVPAYLIEFG